MHTFHWFMLRNCITMHGAKNIKYNYTYIYSIFNLRIEFHVTRMQTKFCRSCPRHIKG